MWIFDQTTQKWKAGTQFIDVSGSGGGGGVTAANRPANPVLFIYDTTTSPGSYVADWSIPGAVVIVGRTNYNSSWAHTMADGGATVMIYLDCIVNSTVGRYHDLLLNSSTYGAAVPLWPGNFSANSTGYLNDFRTLADGSGILHSKLPNVIDLIVSENPHISGIFLDDVGSRSWFPNFDFSAWSDTDKEKYRNGAIEICQIARDKADEHDLFLLVNGTWSVASGTSGSGGYPVRGTGGCSLVDGGTFEHTSTSLLTNVTNDAGPSSQWGADTPRGLNYPLFITSTTADRDFWISHDLAALAFVGSDYGGPTQIPWTSFTDFGLPNRAV